MDPSIIKEIVKHFSLTENIKLAGYIMNDGTLLKLSSNDVYRDLDHMEICRYLRSINIEFNSEEAASNTPYLDEFVKLGNIRINGDHSEVMIGKFPSSSQLTTLDYIFSKNNGKIFLDLISNKAKNTSKCYLEGTLPNTIWNDIFRYYNHGILLSNKI